MDAATLPRRGSRFRPRKVSNKNIKLKIYFQQNEVTHKNKANKKGILHRIFSASLFPSLSLSPLLIYRGLVQVHLSKYQDGNLYNNISIPSYLRLDPPRPSRFRAELNKLFSVSAFYHIQCEYVFIYTCTVFSVCM